MFLNNFFYSVFTPQVRYLGQKCRKLGSRLISLSLLFHYIRNLMLTKAYDLPQSKAHFFPRINFRDIIVNEYFAGTKVSSFKVPPYLFFSGLYISLKEN